MKQFFKRFSMVMMVAVMTVSFSSCKDENGPDSTSIEGRWECVQEDKDDGTLFKMVLTLNSDATGTIDEELSRASYAYSMEFTWSTTTNADGDDILRVSYVDGDKETELFPGSSSTVLWSRKYVLTGNILNIYQGEGVWVFKRI